MIINFAIYTYYTGKHFLDIQNIIIPFKRQQSVRQLDILLLFWCSPSVVVVVCSIVGVRASVVVVVVCK